MKNSPYKDICREIKSLEANLRKGLQRILQIVIRFIKHADSGAIYLYNHKTKLLAVEAFHGYNMEEIKSSPSLTEEPIAYCFKTRQTLVIPSSNLFSQTIDYHMSSGDMVIVPLHYSDRCFGVLELSNRKKRPFDVEEVRAVEEIASWISVIIENVYLRSELQKRKRAYRDLLGKLLTSNEEERKRMAREIHDEVNQLLLCIKLDLEAMDKILPPEFSEIKTKLKNSKSHIERVLDDLRDLSLRLRPLALDDLGLPQALDWYVNNRLKASGFPVVLEIDGVEKRRPAAIVETELFRIAQEALSNAIKHSKARLVKVKLHYDDKSINLSVEDDGKGFNMEDVFEKQLGLLGMRERAKLLGGELQIDSSPGCGTRIKVEVPIATHDWGKY